MLASKDALPVTRPPRSASLRCVQPCIGRAEGRGTRDHGRTFQAPEGHDRGGGKARPFGARLCAGRRPEREDSVQRATDFSASAPLVVIVMGVSGSGKSTLGALLAQRLGAAFLEGDSFHDAAAVAKMRGGQPLDDADRWPWLDRLGAAIGARAREEGRAVAACSALRRCYRERLTCASGVRLRFVLLDGTAAELEQRLAQRAGHYMPGSLLASQLATLEPLAGDEVGVTLDAGLAPGVLCEAVLGWLGAGAGV